MQSEGRVADATVDARLSIQRMIEEGVGLVLALRENERDLADLAAVYHTHDINYILQKAKVERTREALDQVVIGLSALPHTPVKMELDLRALREWMDAHRQGFDQFQSFCENYRPPSPMEDGQVHPRVDLVLSELRDAERHMGNLGLALERHIERSEPEWASRLRRRVKSLNQEDDGNTNIFSSCMSLVEFSELSAEGQRMAIQQHVLRVARDTLDGMLKIKPGQGRVDGLFWVQPPVGRDWVEEADGMEVESETELGDYDLDM
ncbi:hypothetical protein C8R47DRAFT_352988 [Mycena vitilis]|nr:hypothetical protein C8R47DRAFT_352988 [Mycena vitilis]